MFLLRIPTDKVLRYSLLALILGGALAQAQESSFEFDTESAYRGQVLLQTQYIHNTFYDAQRNKPDFGLLVNPFIEASKGTSTSGIQGSLDLLYELYSSNSVQNHFDYNGKLGGRYDLTSNWNAGLYGGYYSFSDPSPNETYGRVPRTQMTGGTAQKFRTTQTSSLEVKFEYVDETIEIPYEALGKYLSNNNIEGVLQFNKAFLPETNWFVRVTGGQRTYPIESTVPFVFESKRDSSYFMGELGIAGRLTERSIIDCGTGYLVREYENAVSTSSASESGANTNDQATASYYGPVFYFKFTEQISRREQLSAGYTYEVRDSYFTNYYIDQEVYIALARVLGDQVLAMGRIAYDYRSYSIPLRREDQRITGAFEVNYSFQPNMKFVATIKFDLLNTDAYDNYDSSPTTLDQPANYRAGSFGVGVVASF